VPLASRQCFLEPVACILHNQDKLPAAIDSAPGEIGHRVDRPLWEPWSTTSLQSDQLAQWLLAASECKLRAQEALAKCQWHRSGCPLAPV